MTWKQDLNRTWAGIRQWRMEWADLLPHRSFSGLWVSVLSILSVFEPGIASVQDGHLQPRINTFFYPFFHPLLSISLYVRHEKGWKKPVVDKSHTQIWGKNMLNGKFKRTLRLLLLPRATFHILSASHFPFMLFVLWWQRQERLWHLV